ncbi:homeobox-leucine zipper protein ATHB-14-like [Camellia sinensis]|uniref:homeobox-leucine zipper protein ATHB-14-like n=1 Tax=Camellia sinensis TaxID=4442 RepID=UPI0010357748|nr:homeobox-leucine zipper protein ATHB-14-like [Camellia sinensis]
MNLVQISKVRLQKMMESGWTSLLDDILSFCEKHEIDVPQIEDMFVARERKMCNVQEITNLHYYRAELFYTVLDMQIQELNARFTESNTELLLCVAFLNPSNSFSGFDRKKLIHLVEFYPKEFSSMVLMGLNDQLDTYIIDMLSGSKFSMLNEIADLAKKMVEIGRGKPGSDSIGIVAISHCCTGVAARACGLVGLEPTRNVPPAILLRFLREHRSEWADNSIDAYSAAAVKVGPCSLPGSRVGSFSGQVILPLAHTIEHEELLEVIKLEGVGHCPEDAIMPRDMFLLQLWSGMDENVVGTCAELIFAPIDASFADDAPLLPSGFRIIPLDSGKEASSPNRTLDLASALEIGPAGNKASNDYTSNGGSTRSVMTIAFEFAFAFEGTVEHDFDV